MPIRLAAASLAVLALLSGCSSPPPTAQSDDQAVAVPPEVEFSEPPPAAIMVEQAGHAQPIALAVDTSEPVAAALPSSEIDGAAPLEEVSLAQAPTNRPAAEEAPGEPAEPAAADAPVLYADGAADMSLRNADFPNTYISRIDVDLTSPTQYVRLTWTGPQAGRQTTGPFHSSTGAGTGRNDCNDVRESNRVDSNCTPKGEFSVEAFSDYMRSYPNCHFVTWFWASRGIAFHSHAQVPNYPASHGCVRLSERAAQLIHNNSLMGKTKVVVDGLWTR